MSFEFALLAIRLKNIMSYPSYGEKVTGLVDYSSSSDDDNPAPLRKKQCLGDLGSDTSSSASEDENPAPHSKKKRLTDSGSSSDNSSTRNGSYYFDAEKEQEMKEYWLSKCFKDDNFLSDDDDDVDNVNFNTDNELLKGGCYSWRVANTRSAEVYCISLAGDSPCKESQCLEFLEKIGCEERFLGCSVEMESFFFAMLNEDEAARIRGLEGVLKVVQRRFTCSIP